MFKPDNIARSLGLVRVTRMDFINDINISLGRIVWTTAVENWRN
jgi:hypothetical protein